jgi:hypothetical protein
VNGPIDAGARGVFVPFDSQLRAAPGHFVARPFWAYINRVDLFPGGWLHDIGLPLSEPLPVVVSKQGQERAITLQVFERTILSNDPRNPAAYQIERVNVGTDYLTAFPWDAEDTAILAAVPVGPSAKPFVLRTIQMVDADVARLYLLHDNSGAIQIDAAWVFVQRQRDGTWRKIAGPSTAFDQATYDRLGIPAMLRLGSDFERSLYDAADKRFPEAVGFRLDRISGGFAKVTTLDADGTQRETIFARLDSINQWTILGNIPTEEQIKFGVPEVLRTYAG